MERIHIYGAGLAGLIAGNMLRRYNPVIFETQPSLPNNHNALLRFRSDEVARAVGIPFRRVRVTKGIAYENYLNPQPSIAFSNMYSRKVSGAVLSRSIDNLEPVDRFIAPEDLISQLARGLNIRYFEALDVDHSHHPTIPSISTIPMPALMKMANWTPVEGFCNKPIWSYSVSVAHLPVNVYQTIYYPDPSTSIYRASITGSRFIVESIAEINNPVQVLSACLSHPLSFGIPSSFKPEDITSKYNPYGKILPYNETDRRRFILHMTDKYNIYSLGRFGTWRQILLDDIVKDINRIASWIEGREGYQRRKDYEK